MYTLFGSGLEKCWLLENGSPLQAEEDARKATTDRNSSIQYNSLHSTLQILWSECATSVNGRLSGRIFFQWHLVALAPKNRSEIGGLDAKNTAITMHLLVTCKIKVGICGGLGFQF